MTPEEIVTLVKQLRELMDPQAQILWEAALTQAFVNAWAYASVSAAMLFASIAFFVAFYHFHNRAHKNRDVPEMADLELLSTKIPPLEYDETASVFQKGGHTYIRRRKRPNSNDTETANWCFGFSVCFFIVSLLWGVPAVNRFVNPTYFAVRHLLKMLGQ